MEITINNQVLQFNVQSWWGPMYIYEEVMDVVHHPERKFDPSRTAYLHIMLYCVLMDDNPILTLTLDEFLKAINDMALCHTIMDFYNKRIAAIMDLQPEAEPEQSEESAAPSKKKGSRRTKPTRG